MTCWVVALLRPLLLVVAALGLLGTGGVEPAPRAGATVPVAAAASGVAVRAGAPSVPRTDASTPAPVLRATVASASAPTSGGSELPPAAGPLVAPHLVSAPQARPPVAPDNGLPHGVPDGRAPPLTTGT